MEPTTPFTFPPADKAAWRAQVAKELNDLNAGESLRWPAPDGFLAEPYYTAEDINALPLSVLQSFQKPSPGWLNAPDYTLTDEPTADNRTLRHALANGADALVLNVLTSHELARLTRQLDGIKLSDTPVFFRVRGNVADFVRALRTLAPYQLRGGLLTEAPEPANLAEAIRLTLDSPYFRPVGVYSHDFHNAGATATQELAFLLARLADTYDFLTDAGLSVEQLAPKTLLSVSVGTSYFLEIAKLRALRVLWQRFVHAYEQAHHPPFVHAQTSTFYDAAVTPYTNLLRATTEAMAAVIGGCDTLTVHPYDTVLSAPSEFSERIARNVSVLLKEESYLDKVADPSAGSYYVENLTQQLVERAWTLFMRVEQMGGLAKAFAAGFVPDEIERSYRAKLEAVQNGRVLVGVTKFRFDEADTPKPVRSAKDSNGLGVLPDRRLAEPFE